MNAKHSNTSNIKFIALLVMRIIFGCVFIFSGLVKAIDPLGTAYKITDYLTAMGITLPDWMPLSASVFLCSLEFLIGINMLLGIRLKETTIVGFLMMCFMTPLTFWIAIANPVSDCGCFGDALIIDNWTTFWKNIVLMALIIGIWLLRRSDRPWVTGLTSWLITATFFLLCIVIAVYSLKHLPYRDFRPYHIGANIYEGMQLKEGEEPDLYETYFIYEKDGKEQQFELVNIPYTDSTWTFVSQETKLIKKGASPAIHDFVIFNNLGDDITDDILQSTSKSYLIIMYDLQKSNWEFVDELNELQQKAEQEGSNIMILTASEQSVIDEYQKTYNLTIPFNLTDPITLKTMIRANPGIVVLKDATVIDKWNIRDQAKHLKKHNE